ncbi:hypothetical protein BDDG_13356, partial [Blastomyces dermatitidis ATCC 18188]
SSCVDRFTFTNDCDFNVELLIENLENVIMKKLSVSCITESLMFSPALSVSFSATFSQSSTSAPVSGSPAPATSIPATSTVSTSAPVTAFVTSSPCFKKILYRLSKLHFSVLVFTLMSEAILIEDDNTAETTLFCSQASLITFSSFSTEKIITLIIIHLIL